MLSFSLQNMAITCSSACSPSSSYQSSSCRSPLHSTQSTDSFTTDVCGRKLFQDKEFIDQGDSKKSLSTFADTRKKLSFPSPEVSELHEHLQALDGLDGQAKQWPFSRKHRSTPNTSPKKKPGPISIQKIAAEIRAIEMRSIELHHDQSLRNDVRASKKHKLWLISLGFISVVLACMLFICYVPIVFSLRQR
jgi:hypothetical protein